MVHLLHHPSTHNPTSVPITSYYDPSNGGFNFIGYDTLRGPSAGDSHGYFGSLVGNSGPLEGCYCWLSFGMFRFFTYFV